MKLNEIYHFGDVPHFKGWVVVDDVDISLLEQDVKRIREAFEILKKESNKS